MVKPYCGWLKFMGKVCPNWNNVDIKEKDKERVNDAGKAIEGLKSK